MNSTMTLYSDNVMLTEDFRGETSLSTYVLKVLGAAFICIAELIQVAKVLRSRKTKNLSTPSYALKSFAFLFLGIQSSIDVADGRLYEIGWLCVYWLAFLAEMGLALFITANKWN